MQTGRRQPLPPRAIIGMVHARALPGAPEHSEAIERIAGQAAEEARELESAGFDAIIVENMHDAPYVHGAALGPEIVASMTRVAVEVAQATQIPLGVQILSGGNRHALAVAQAAGGLFIRCENFVFSHVADEGVLAEAEAGALLRYRRTIGASDVAVFADIKKKHASHAITADVSIEQAAEAAAFFGADTLIVTGAWTGKPAEEDDLQRARSATDLPVLVGSGVTAESAAHLMDVADGLIVGSAIKRDGGWRNPVDPARAEALVRSAKRSG